MAAGLIIYIANYNYEKNNKKSISFKHIVNNTDDKDGYYIPKDSLLNPYYKKCSVENCKRCYGNSYNDTCISCLNYYDPIMNKNNKIISCKYNPQKDEENITLNKSDKINIIDGISEINTELLNEIITDNIQENKNEFVSDKNIYYIQENNTEFITDKNIYYIQENKTEFLFSNISSYFIEENINEFTTNDIITNISQNNSIEIIKEFTSSNIIKSCEIGYYLPEDSNKCKQCSMIGSEICHGNSKINYCDLCFPDYYSKYINNNLTCIKCENNCIECEDTLKCLKCDNEYALYEGKCLAYSFMAIYKTSSNNQKIKLII